jgi:alkylated DNA repair dioxygenase AlkB
MNNAISYKLSMDQADVIFYAGLFAATETTIFFTQLLEQIAWQQEPIKIFGKSILQPRLTAYYGTEAYKYSGITMQPLPWNTPLLEIKEKIEPLVNTEFNGVLLNLYRHGQDSMGWHSDDEKELAKDSVIASLSLGETRRFIFRRKDNHKIKVELNLADGDFFTMAGNTQKYWQHQVPKMAKSSQPRINLTFRVIQY